MGVATAKLQKKMKFIIVFPGTRPGPLEKALTHNKFVLWSQDLANQLPPEHASLLQATEYKLERLKLAKPILEITNKLWVEGSLDNWVNQIFPELEDTFAEYMECIRSST